MTIPIEMQAGTAALLVKAGLDPAVYQAFAVEASLPDIDWEAR